MRGYISPAALVLFLLWMSVHSLSAFTTVVVDAGHGGGDRGGIPGQRYAEKTYTLDVAQRLASLLTTQGLKVVMTRNSDTFIELSRRCYIANKTPKCIFVSIHFDAYYSATGHGVTTYYTRSNSRNLAQYVHVRMIQKLKPRQDRGIKRSRFFVTRNTAPPAILVEGGFLTHYQWEAKRILQPEYRQAMAEAIAQGINDYKQRDD